MIFSSKTFKKLRTVCNFYSCRCAPVKGLSKVSIMLTLGSPHGESQATAAFPSTLNSCFSLLQPPTGKLSAPSCVHRTQFNLVRGSLVRPTGLAPPYSSVTSCPLASTGRNSSPNREGQAVLIFRGRIFRVEPSANRVE